MSDWDFLHDMREEGYSPEQILDAAGCGYNPDKVDLSSLGYSPEEWEDVDGDELDHFAANPELVSIFEDLVGNAESFYELTNRYLQIWGELGELYAKSNMALSDTNLIPEALTAGLVMTLSR